MAEEPPPSSDPTEPLPAEGSGWVTIQEVWIESEADPDTLHTDGEEATLLAEIVDMDGVLNVDPATPINVWAYYPVDEEPLGMLVNTATDEEDAYFLEVTYGDLLGGFVHFRMEASGGSMAKQPATTDRWASRTGRRIFRRTRPYPARTSSRAPRPNALPNLEDWEAAGLSGRVTPMPLKEAPANKRSETTPSFATPGVAAGMVGEDPLYVFIDIEAGDLPCGAMRTLS